MPIVKSRENESFEQLIRRFKKQCEKAGVLTEIRKREHFEKPSIKNKRRNSQALKRAQKKNGGSASQATGRVKMKDWAINF